MASEVRPGGRCGLWVSGARGGSGRPLLVPLAVPNLVVRSVHSSGRCGLACTPWTASPPQLRPGLSPDPPIGEGVGRFHRTARNVLGPRESQSPAGYPPKPTHRHTQVERDDVVDRPPRRGRQIATVGGPTLRRRPRVPRRPTPPPVGAPRFNGSAESRTFRDTARAGSCAMRDAGICPRRTCPTPAPQGLARALGEQPVEAGPASRQPPVTSAARTIDWLEPRLDTATGERQTDVEAPPIRSAAAESISPDDWSESARTPVAQSRLLARGTPGGKFRSRGANRRARAFARVDRREGRVCWARA